MNRVILVCLGLTLSFLGQSQENTAPKVVKVKTAKNGINVYKSKGVENESKVDDDTKLKARKPISAYTLEECENAIYFVRLKLKKAIEDNENARIVNEYKTTLSALEDRLFILKPTTK